jgi:hypothetical protein
MSATDTMRWMGRSARHRAETFGHSMKGRAMERRLARTTDEAERLRLENQVLREEVERERDDHHRMFEMLESRLAAPEPEVEVEIEGGKKRSHRGRWFLFLTALGGGAYALVKMRSQGNGQRDEWSETQGPAVTQSGTATA